MPCTGTLAHEILFLFNGKYEFSIKCGGGEGGVHIFDPVPYPTNYQPIFKHFLTGAGEDARGSRRGPDPDPTGA